MSNPGHVRLRKREMTCENLSNWVLTIHIVLDWRVDCCCSAFVSAISVHPRPRQESRFRAWHKRLCGNRPQCIGGVYDHFSQGRSECNHWAQIETIPSIRVQKVDMRPGYFHGRRIFVRISTFRQKDDVPTANAQRPGELT